VKKRLKLLLLWLARSIGLFWLARRLTRRGFVIVGWHGVSLSNEHERFTSLFVSPETFRRRLDYVCRKFKVASLAEALEQHARGEISPGQVVLTFDDGFFNFLAVAAPILRELGLPATVYIVSHDMVSQEPIANLIVRDLLLSTRRSQVESSLLGTEGCVSLATDPQRKGAIRLALDRLHRFNGENGNRLSFIRQLADDLDVDAEELIRRRVWHALSADEMRQLAGEGFDMQLHSHRHGVVTDMSQRQLREDLTTCRNLVEEATGREARDFCYPFGMWSRSRWPVLEAAGVRSAVTTHLGPNFVRTPRLALRRFLDGEDRSQLEFEFEMSGLRWLFHTLLHPARRYQPSEKSTYYYEDGILF